MGGNYIIICCRGRFAPATTGRRITIREVAWREAPHNHADQPDFARPKLRFVRARRLSAAPLCVMTNDMLTAADGAAESELHGAAWSGDLEQVKHVVTAGADVNWADSIGETALFGASAWGHAAVVRCLLMLGANPNLQNQDGVTPLHWAASHGNVDTIRALVEAGADPTVPDKRNRLPIDAAHEHGKGAHVAVLKTVGPPIASRRKPK